jgi:hypothetical protein
MSQPQPLNRVAVGAIIVVLGVLVGLVMNFAALGAMALLDQDGSVPKRRNALRIEVALMAEECEWENGRMTLLDGLRCVREKIDVRVKDLEEPK